MAVSSLSCLFLSNVRRPHQVIRDFLTSAVLVRPWRAASSCVLHPPEVSPELFLPQALCGCSPGWYGSGKDCRRCPAGGDVEAKRSLPLHCPHLAFFFWGEAKGRRRESKIWENILDTCVRGPDQAHTTSTSTEASASRARGSKNLLSGQPLCVCCLAGSGFVLRFSNFLNKEMRCF